MVMTNEEVMNEIANMQTDCASKIALIDKLITNTDEEEISDGELIDIIADILKLGVDDAEKATN